MISKIPYCLVVGGVFWTIVFSLGISSYMGIQFIKYKPKSVLGFFSCAFVVSVLLTVLGTGLGWMMGQSPWLETRDMISQLIDPYPIFDTPHITREGARSPDITKEDADAFMAHLHSLPSNQSNLSNLSNRKMQPAKVSFRSLENKTPYSDVVSVH